MTATHAETSATQVPAPAARPPGKPWSLREGAEFVGVCQATLERACRAKRVKSVKVGRRVLIADDELRRVAREGF